MSFRLSAAAAAILMAFSLIGVPAVAEETVVETVIVCKLAKTELGTIEVCHEERRIVVSTEQGGGGSGTPAGATEQVAPQPEWRPPAEVCRDVLAVAPDDSGCKQSIWRDRFGSVPVVDISRAAAEAAASLEVPPPELQIGPDPSMNKWGVLAVGLPVWVWSDDPGPISTSIEQDGLGVSITADRGAVTIDWGDGTTSVCQTLTPRPVAIDPLTSSPDCGHTYLKKGDYTISATASWNASWQAAGSSGSATLSSASSYTLPIREFVSVVVG